MDEDDDQDIYDDGTSITNKCAVGRIKSMFEPAMQGPKPNLPSKPSVKPPPPKRSDVTKPVLNGNINSFPKNNIMPKKSVEENSDKDKDENSNVKSDGGPVKPNSELASKFNSIRSKLEVGDKPVSKPSWQKTPDVDTKPTEVKKSVGKLPVQGSFASRVASFQKTGDISEDDKNKTETRKPQILEKTASFAEKKAAIFEKSKFSYSVKTDNKPPSTPLKPDNKQPPITPKKPSSASPVEPQKPFASGNSKPFSPKPPFSPGGGQSELLMKIKKRKESLDQVSDSELKGIVNKTSTTQPTEDEPQLRKKGRQMSVKHRKSFTRVADKKKFYLVEISAEKSSEKPPLKPPKVSNIDLNCIVSEYKRKFISTVDEERPLSQGLIEEDIYEELPEAGDEETDDFPPPPDEIFRHKSVSNRAVSLIEPMTEHDELGADEVYDEGFSVQSDESPPPVVPGRPPKRANLPDGSVSEPPATNGQDTYENKEEDGSDGELYEPLDDIIIEVAKLEEKSSTNDLTDTKTEQLSEKERKRKEKEREKEEKRKQEEEKKKLDKKVKELKKYKIEQSELDPANTKGAGTIKEDSKGKGKELLVKKDQRIVILCIDKRVPAGKWLIMLEDDSDVIGLVDSNNVEVDNTIIRTVMQNSKKTPIPDLIDDQEEYADVDVEQDELYAEAD